MSLTYDRFSAIIPAYNEAKTLAYVIEEVLKTARLGELLIIDDGSTDETSMVVNSLKSDKRLIYIHHEKNRGKGAALRTGIKRAKNEILLFLDADLKNITSAKITKIVNPVLNDDVDLSRARFKRSKGRVTEIAAKPMMRILFPDQNFDQPITGQICGKKSFFSTVSLDIKWGVDIGILLDAIESGQRIQEVDIGKLEHRHHTDSELSLMAEQVLETMIKKAGLIQHKYKLIIFTLDETLIAKDSLNTVWRKLHLFDQMQALVAKLEDDEISYPEYLLEAARLYKGKTLKEIEDASQAIKFEAYAPEVLKALKQRKFSVGIVTPGLSPVVNIVAKRLGITNYECVDLRVDTTNHITGTITQKSKINWLNQDIEAAVIDAAKRVAKKTGTKLSEAVIVANSSRMLPIFDNVGLSIAYRSKSKNLKAVADKTITVLAEILALVE